jgi:hypothetical protein
MHTARPESSQLGRAAVDVKECKHNSAGQQIPVCEACDAACMPQTCLMQCCVLLHWLNMHAYSAPSAVVAGWAAAMPAYLDISISGACDKVVQVRVATDTSDRAVMISIAAAAAAA